MKRSQSGFTLLEVMVALTIMSLIMVSLYTVLHTTLRTRDVLDNEVRAARVGPELLDLIERDLRRVWVPNLADDKILLGEDRSMLGQPADSISFVSMVTSTTTRRGGEHEVPSELCETGYRLRVNPDLPDVLQLWRRQDYHLDDEPLRDGVYSLVSDRVIGFDVQYYEDRVLEHEPLDEWDTEQRHAMPAMIRIRLGLEIGPRVDAADRRAGQTPTSVRWYERVIVFDDERDLAMRVHPYPPALNGAASSGGGAGAGGPNDSTEGQDGKPPVDSGGGGDNPDLGGLLDELFGSGGGG